MKISHYWPFVVPGTLLALLLISGQAQAQNTFKICQQNHQHETAPTACLGPFNGEGGLTLDAGDVSCWYEPCTSASHQYLNSREPQFAFTFRAVPHIVTIADGSTSTVLKIVVVSPPSFAGWSLVSKYREPEPGRVFGARGYPVLVQQSSDEYYWGTHNAANGYATLGTVDSSSPTRFIYYQKSFTIDTMDWSGKKAFFPWEDDITWQKNGFQIVCVTGSTDPSGQNACISQQVIPTLPPDPLSLPSISSIPSSALVPMFRVCSPDGLLCVGSNSNTRNGQATACLGNPCDGPAWEFPGAVPPNQAYLFKAVASSGNLVQLVVVSPPERADMWLQPWAGNPVYSIPGGGATYFPYYVSGSNSNCFADCQNGGFGESAVRSLTAKLHLQHGQTPSSCALLALQAGYTYFGVQDGGQCFADNSPPSQGLASSINTNPPLACNKPCQTNTSLQCGGSCANAVFTVTKPVMNLIPGGGGATYSPYYVSGSNSNCFADCQNGGFGESAVRSLTAKLHLQHGQTPSSCALLALQAGYTYFGVQDGGQCFADNSPPSQGLASSININPPLACNKPCQTNSAHQCGGGCANAVFTITKPASLLLTKHPQDNDNSTIYNWNWGAVSGAANGWLATLGSTPRAISNGTSAGIVTSANVANATRWTARCAVGFVLDPLLKNLCIPKSQVSLLKICSPNGALCVGPNSNGAARACFGNPCNGPAWEFPGAVLPNQAYLFKAVASPGNLVQLVVVFPPERADMWLQPSGNSEALLLTKNPQDNNNSPIYNWNWGTVTGSINGWLATLGSTPLAISGGTSTGIVTSTNVANATRWAAWCDVGFVLDPLLKNLCIPTSQVSLLKICSSDGALCVGSNSNGAAAACFGNPCNDPVREFPGAVPPNQAYLFKAVASSGNLVQLVVVSPPERADMWLQPWAGNLEYAIPGGGGAIYSPYYVSGSNSNCFADCQNGGFGESAVRSLTAKLHLQHGQTPSSCALLALQAGYTYFGVQDGGQCFADNSPPSQGLASSINTNPPLACNKPCQTNTSQQCGGSCANAVFTITKPAALLLTKNPQDNNNNPIYNWNWGTVTGAVNGWLATLGSTPRAISGGTSTGIVTSTDVANATRWAAWCVPGTVSVPPFSQLCVSRDFFRICHPNGHSCLGPNTDAICFGGTCSRNDTQNTVHVPRDQGAFQFSAVATRGVDGMSLLQLVCVSPVQLAGWWLQQTVQQTSVGPITTVRLVNSGALTPLDYWTIAATSSNNVTTPKNVLLTVDSDAQNRSLYIIGPSKIKGSNNSDFIVMSSNSSRWWQFGWQLFPVPQACKVGVVSERVPCYCDAGKYVDSGKICQLCPKGHICPIGFLLLFGVSLLPPVPVACPPGQHPDSKSVRCVDCPPGKYTADPTLSSCTDCELGKYASSAGSSSCTDCVAGSYSNYTGATICTDCHLGEVNNHAAQSTCQQCAPGTYSNVTRGTQCLDCQPGYAQNMTGQAICIECQAGYFSNTTKQDYCSPCKPGYYANRTATICSSCQPGYYANQTAASRCEACWPGSHNIYIGATQCYGCTGEWFSPSPGAANCTLCPPPSWSQSLYTSKCSPIRDVTISANELASAVLRDWLSERDLSQYYLQSGDPSTAQPTQVWQPPLSDLFAQLDPPITPENLNLRQPLEPQLSCLLDFNDASDCSLTEEESLQSKFHVQQHSMNNSSVTSSLVSQGSEVQHVRHRFRQRAIVEANPGVTATLHISCEHAHNQAVLAGGGMMVGNLHVLRYRNVGDLHTNLQTFRRLTTLNAAGTLFAPRTPFVPLPGGPVQCLQAAGPYVPSPLPPFGPPAPAPAAVGLPVPPPAGATGAWTADVQLVMPAGGNEEMPQYYEFEIYQTTVAVPTPANSQLLDVQPGLARIKGVFTNVMEHTTLFPGLFLVSVTVRCFSGGTLLQHNVFLRNAADTTTYAQSVPQSCPLPVPPGATYIHTLDFEINIPAVALPAGQKYLRLESSAATLGIVRNERIQVTLKTAVPAGAVSLFTSYPAAKGLHYSGSELRPSYSLQLFPILLDHEGAFSYFESKRDAQTAATWWLQHLIIADAATAPAGTKFRVDPTTTLGLWNQMVWQYRDYWTVPIPSPLAGNPTPARNNILAAMRTAKARYGPHPFTPNQVYPGGWLGGADGLGGQQKYVHEIEDMGKKSIDIVVNMLVSDWEKRNVVALVEFEFENKEIFVYSPKRFASGLGSTSAEVEYVLAVRPRHDNTGLGNHGANRHVKPLLLIEAKRRKDFTMKMQTQVLAEAYLATVHHHISDQVQFIPVTHNSQILGICVLASDSDRYMFYRVLRDPNMEELVTWRSRVYNAETEIHLILEIAHNCIASRWLGIFPALQYAQSATFPTGAPPLDADIGGAEPNAAAGSATFPEIPRPAVAENGLVDNYINHHINDLQQVNR